MRRRAPSPGIRSRAMRVFPWRGKILSAHGNHFFSRRRVIHRSCGELVLRALLASANNSGIPISRREACCAPMGGQDARLTGRQDACPTRFTPAVVQKCLRCSAVAAEPSGDGPWDRLRAFQPPSKAVSRPLLPLATALHISPCRGGRLSVLSLTRMGGAPPPACAAPGAGRSGSLHLTRIYESRQNRLPGGQASGWSGIVRAP